jgi:hypothetical protein
MAAQSCAEEQRRDSPRRTLLMLSVAGIMIEIHTVAGHSDDRVENAKQLNHSYSFLESVYVSEKRSFFSIQMY